MGPLRRLSLAVLLVLALIWRPGRPALAYDALPQTAPCMRAVTAAVTARGAIYSQGGYHPNDPIDPETETYYPRTGPRSFDCSGLVWWAYAQAGITIGQTTYQQLDDGVALPCALADFNGAATRCWAPGDLIFLTYSGGQHVAIYVGQGLVMDCYNHANGCILHNPTLNSFYRTHFRANAGLARRIVSGCEGMTTDPGFPNPPTPDGPTFEELPDLSGYVTSYLPQCNACDGSDPIFQPGEPPTGDWYDLTYGFRWLAWAIEDIIRKVLCWLLGLAQQLINVAVNIANTFIRSANQVWKFLLFTWLTLRTWLYALWEVIEIMRAFFVDALHFFTLLGLWFQAIIDLFLIALDLAGQLVLLLLNLVASLLQLLGWIGGLALSLILALLGSLQSTSVPPQLQQGGSPVYQALRGTLEGLHDSQIGWLFYLTYALAYVAFILWLSRFLSAAPAGQE